MMINPSQFSGITSDSRLVQNGYIFVAVPGVKADGRRFIQDAILRGAKAIIVPTGTEKAEIPSDVEWHEVSNVHLFLAKTAAAFYKDQPSYIAAVTGTNGKTSTVNFARMIWEDMGIKGASLGTLGLLGKGLDGYTGMTTPDPVRLMSDIAQVANHGFSHLAMEASSHGIHQHRLDGVRIKSAGFTNLTRDHLDYHETMEGYFAAKLRLFTELLDADGVAVLNSDIPEFSTISSTVRSRGQKIISYGTAEAADLRIVERQAVTTGQDIHLNAFGKDFRFHLNLVGEFQLMNILCAVGLVIAEGNKEIENVLDILPRLSGVIGRLQMVPHQVKDVGVYIDYAHTPDGLETILKALRPHTRGRLISVFGCGGDRDRGKRPVMGEISTRLADITIVTDDNPRTEDPAFIRSEVMAGAVGAKEIPGRREAIRAAVQYLQPGDVLVVAGKGHEQGQIFAGYTEPFDDLSETQNALSHFFS